MTDTVKSLTVAELKTELKGRNLSTTGRKAELLTRLLQSIDKDDDESDDGLSAVTSMESTIVTEDEVSPDLVAAKKQKLAEYRSQITLYRHPHVVLRHFIHYLAHEAKVVSLYLVSHRFILPTAFVVALTMWLGYTLEGPHQATVRYVESILLWYGYWVILGIMSSVGLGTGLHTFVLFLGPHIAEATRAAYLCGNLNFAVRGDNAFVCMDNVAKPIAVTMWNIIRIVQWQSFFWGAGTAIGELPPYFVARAAALAGRENEELAALDALQGKEARNMSLKEKLLVKVHYVMQNLGFFGIFLSASIPNPLFDLAGITCGHFLVPFATFFGATFLGKAIVKAGIQMVFVILMFSEESMAVLLSFLEKCLPRLKTVIESALNEQAKTFGAQKDANSSDVSGKTNYVSLAWNAIITIMLSYFALSIIESLALSNLERVHAREIKKMGNGIRTEDRKSK